MLNCVYINIVNALQYDVDGMLCACGIAPMMHGLRSNTPRNSVPTKAEAEMRMFTTAMRSS